MRRSGLGRRSRFGVIGALALASIAPVLPASARASRTSMPTGIGKRPVWQAEVQQADYVHDLVSSPDGTKVFVVGGTNDAFLTVAYDSTQGRTLWSARFHQPPEGYDDALAVGVSPDGALLYVTGSAGVPGQSDFVTIAYDSSTGTQRWLARYNPYNESDVPVALAVSPDGRVVYVTGSSVAPLSGTDFATVAYDASTGDQVWDARFEGFSQSSTDTPADMALSKDGSRLYVVGSASAPNFNAQFAAVAYDANTGDQLWASRYEDPSKPYDVPAAVAASPDGTAVYVTGCMALYNSCEVSDYLTVSFDTATGAERWVSTYDDIVDGTDFPVGIGTSLDGSLVYVAGSSDQQAFPGYATIAYRSSDGTQAWISQYAPFNRRAYACCMAVSPNGTSVLVTGWTGGKYYGSEDFTTLAYDPSTGSQLWAGRFGTLPPAGDYPNAIGTTPDGGLVFVAGDVESAAWVTIAYRT